MLGRVAERTGECFMNKEQAGPTSSADVCARLYMRLLKRCLTRDLFPDQRYDYGDLVHPVPYSKELRQNGRDWPTEADTMVGMKRLDNLHDCCWTAVRESVPGDFVETGVWRGGCGILIIDDYGAIPSCKAAVDDFRAQQSILSAISE